MLLSFWSIIQFLAFWCSFPPNSPPLPDLYEAGIASLQSGLENGHFTSEHLVKAYLARIEEVNLKGPKLHAVIETNPSALSQAIALDEERKRSGARGILHGIPILVKDNIATLFEEGMNTTAGSYALLKSVVPRDASIISRLRAAGAIILGKANMSEWADFRGYVSAWSARGGQCTNPYFPGGDPDGSSSGSATAAAIGLAAAALGTETDGSIVTPACRQNVVGVKPTVGLTSRDGIIPASEHQDSAGILARSVTDAAVILRVIAGKDARDNYTLGQPNEVPDYMSGLRKTALRGVRLGVPRNLFENDSMAQLTPEITAAFNASIQVFKKLGAIVIEPADYPAAEEIGRRITENVVLVRDFKANVQRYMSELIDVPSGARSLADLIAFNNANPSLELPPGYEDQHIFERAEALPGFDQTYYDALDRDTWLGTEGSIDYALRTYKLDALIMPSRGTNSAPAALAGYPMVSVPLGFFPDDTPVVVDGHTIFPAPGIPFGIAFTASAFTESRLLSYAYAFEQYTQIRLARRAYPAAVPKTQLRDVI